MAASTFCLDGAMIRAISRQSRKRSAVSALLIFMAVCRLQTAGYGAAPPSSVERGRQLYISQGCSKCHYLTSDRAKHSIVNQRQRIDLSQVGVRRSPLWLKIHLFNPSEVSGASIMPSYAFLFQDKRGDDLVAYLSSLRSPSSDEHLADENHWHLPGDVIARANAVEGQRLYDRFCATCHNPNGRTRATWRSSFTEQPAVLEAGALSAAQSANASSRIDHLAHIIKFGIPDSDMAGHEYLPDRDIASLALWLTQDVVQPVPNRSR
jgi:cytochrome c oxidase cbb3-type subunit 2